MALVLLLVVSGCGASGADARDVVYSVAVDGNVDVYKVESGGDTYQLTTSQGADSSPAWSPNKESIAFISDRNGAAALWLMDSSGESKRQVSSVGDEVLAFRWSPDSVRIAVEFSDQSSGNHRISILDTETDESSPLTSASEDARVGDWSPDSEWVVYSVLDGSDAAIRRKNPNGVDEITLFSGSWTSEGISPNPRWSRNGQWIAFVQESGDLVVMDKDGENLSLAVGGVDKFVPHDWSPDSKRLVFVIGELEDSEIYVVGRDGKGVKQLTSNRVGERAPLWSSDGASILFQSEGAGSFDIYSMGKDGEKQVGVTSTAVDVGGANW
jgi:Tol biopolymer transport system component